LGEPETISRGSLHAYPSLLTRIDDFERLADEWNTLALAPASPFLTVDWLLSWWTAYGAGEPATLVLRDDRGRLVAGAFCRRRRHRLESCANLQSGDWDAVARDERARRALWVSLAELAPARVRFGQMIATADATTIASDELVKAGFRVFRQGGPRSPYLPLPGTWAELAQSVSRNLRSQVGRRRRGLEKQGELRLRKITGGNELTPAFESMLRLESTGWKAERGSPIVKDPGLEALHRTFVRRAAHRGWLRLYLLELDGEPIAGDYGCAFGGVGFLLKTGFDDRHSRLSPGLVLRAEVLRASIEEGLRGYDFLGGADSYKLRWTSKVRQRITLVAYRGRSTMLERAYWSQVRPRLKQLRDLGRAARTRLRSA
jgi:CelD/BcsL family acetyltransferase involved in cellulose biosynthesis